MTSDAFSRALPASEVPHGAKRVIEIEGKSVLVCNWNGRLYAVSNVCSHAHEMLEPGRLGNGWISCPIHGARFDLATGAAKNPPATKPIAVFEARLVEDWIEVKV